MSDHLLRHLAPLSDRAWAGVEQDVTPRLAVQLAARRLVDFAGPDGWDLSAINLGHVEQIPGPAQGVESRLRRVLPLVEIRMPFALSRRALDDFDRGATDVALDALDGAASAFAFAENRAVFHGYGEAGIRGIVEASGHDPIELEASADHYPRSVARAVDVLRNVGIGGPYGLAICPDLYTRIAQTAEHGGFPLFHHLGEILGGPVVWAPGIESGAVVSLRGGDYTFQSGQDIALGYLGHDDEEVRLYLEESFTFRVNEENAAVALTSPSP